MRTYIHTYVIWTYTDNIIIIISSSILSSGNSSSITVWTVHIDIDTRTYTPPLH